MSLGEFELIRKYFCSHDAGQNVNLGIGDDCALTSVPQGMELAITTDTQTEGIHFFKGTDPYLLGWKSLLVNLSDLASMGAKPVWFTLSLSLPDSSDDFLESYSKGLFDLASSQKIALIGGNTTKGLLSFTITAYGFVKKDTAMLRQNAKVGDGIYVTGTLGLPALAVDLGYEKYKNSLLNFDRCYQKSMLIEPRNAFACELARYCHCAIDISDGLVGDLRHVLEQSEVGASINVDSLPKASELNLVEEDYADRLCLFGGGDYELLFTLDDSKAEEVLKLAAEYNINVTQIGTIKNRQLDFVKHGKIVEYNFTSFEHF